MTTTTSSLPNALGAWQATRPWLLAALAAALCACHAGNAAKPIGSDATAARAIERRDGALFIPESSPLRQSLQMAAAEERSVQRSLTLPAVVEADPGRLVRMVPPVAGRIVQLTDQPGQAVKAGDTLFVLDAPDMASANADAQKARAAVAVARQNLQRQTQLDEQHIGVRRDLEQAQSDLQQAAAEAERAQQRLSQLGGSADAAAGPSRRYVQKSPISGQVVEVAGARGAFWADTTAPILVVADLSKEWVVASVGERDLAAVSAGQAATIAFDAYGDETVDATVRYVGALLDPDTRSVKLRLPLANAQGRYRPGMFAHVVLAGPAHPAVTVPETALVQSGFDTRVFVETAPWTFEARAVRTAAPSNGRTEITQGLRAGERVVVRDGVLLND